MRRRDATVYKAEAQFNDWAAHYDSDIWSRYFVRGYRRAAVILEGSVPDSPRILDLGCGTGALACLLSARMPHGRVVGLDLSQKMIEQCGQRKGHSVDFLLGEASDLPFANASFDAVACLNSFHHYPDAHTALKEIVRCLVPGGTLLLLDQVRDGAFRRFWVAILRRLFHDHYAGFHTSEELIAMLESAGLEFTRGEYFVYLTRFMIATKPSQSPAKGATRQTGEIRT